MGVFTVVQHSSRVMVAPLQRPEVDGPAGLTVSIRTDGLDLKHHRRRNKSGECGRK